MRELKNKLTTGKNTKNIQRRKGKSFGYQVLGFGSGGSVKLNDVGIDILLVAGGGGGGTCATGAGGGGGVVLIPAPNGTNLLNLSVENTIVIGGGGAGGVVSPPPGNGDTGVDTTIDSTAGQIIAKGGGRNFNPGGSGGGPGRGTQNAPCNAIQGCQAGVSGSFGFGFGGGVNPSFEIAKCMAQSMQLQNVKIITIMQTKTKRPTSGPCLHQKGGGGFAAAAFFVQILA